MEILRQYMLSVITISIVCGLVVLFFEGSPYKDVIKLITGLMVTISVLKPVMNKDAITLDKFWNRISADSSYAVSQGQEAAAHAHGAYIIETMESYISSRAEEMGAEVTAQVTLQEGTIGQPKEVTLSGRVSPYLKNRICQMIETELGIEKDQQIWIS